MRNAETILGIISNRGKRKLPLEDIYRQLFNRDFYLQAYSRLYRNQGAMTQGITEETVDAMSLEKIDNIIKRLRDESYRWTPVRRVKIPKSKQPGKFRTLGLPTWSDKLLQEVIRMILEAYYEPQFSRYSHGFRPERGCHTALSEIRQHWRGVKWFIEGDISTCFDSIDHNILLSMLQNKFHDNRFMRLISNLFKAGYLEDWKYQITLSGVPQGGIVSPCLSNVYLNELDQFVESTLLSKYNRGKRRKRNSQYDNMMAMTWYKKKRGEYEEAKLLRQQAQKLSSSETHDPSYRRLWYIRYADDWLLGFIGPREEAETIKRQLKEFLCHQLKLQLSDEKTLITHARTQAARFLGYEIVTLHNDAYQQARKRSLNGGIGLKVPITILQNKCARYMRQGKPASLFRRMGNSDYSITAQYQAEYRGFVQYYLMAFNVHRLWWLHYVMKRSLAKTLARKHKTSVREIFRKYQTIYITPHKTHTVFEVKHERKNKTSLIARFGGISLCWKKQLILNDNPVRVYNTRTEILERLLRGSCELCGSEENCNVHHVRKLADINKPGRKEKPLWIKWMIARRRKTLVVCKNCHCNIHNGQINLH